MLYTGLFKRIIPFVLTFGLGLLLASLFGAALLPNFEGRREARRNKRCNDRQQLILEIDRLNQELRDVRLENETLRDSSWERQSFELTVPPPHTMDEHHPPAPPKRPKNPRRVETLQ
jgi:hypothetical protein